MDVKFQETFAVWWMPNGVFFHLIQFAIFIKTNQIFAPFGDTQNFDFLLNLMKIANFSSIRR
jgi:hypothetical protein